MEERINLKEFFRVVKKRYLILIEVIVISLVVGGLTSFCILKPVYQAKTTLLVTCNKCSETITSDQMLASEKLATMYREIIKSKSVLDKVIQNLDIDINYDELYEKISVYSVNDTQVITIKVNDSNNKRAKDIANETVDVFIKELKEIPNIGDIYIIDRAILPKDPIKPNKAINLVISATFGAILGVFVIFLIEYSDKKKNN